MEGKVDSKVHLGCCENNSVPDATVHFLFLFLDISAILGSQIFQPSPKMQSSACPPSRMVLLEGLWLFKPWFLWAIRVELFGLERSWIGYFLSVAMKRNQAEQWENDQGESSRAWWGIEGNIQRGKGHCLGNTKDIHRLKDKCRIFPQISRSFQNPRYTCPNPLPLTSEHSHPSE